MSRLNHHLMRLDEAAKALRVHRTTALRWVHSGDLVALQVGRNWRVPRAALPRGQSGRQDGQQRDQVRAKNEIIVEVLVQLDRSLPGEEYLKPLEVRQVLRCSRQELVNINPPSTYLGREQRFPRDRFLAWIADRLSQVPSGGDSDSSDESPDSGEWS